ncbi:hypothetical protein IFDJLNFL_5653 [Methylobacterium dankookense]|uniref:Uncharacterized protein n=1 Tax=Methylobacterium dankookense TaxID=560405 RepID=A0ABQ4RT05_9HYPH|nr:hypothetical protein IFDJLNFL_5653 [Methylobacterium dankookense]
MSEDLPEPLAPMTPSPSPARSEKVASSTRACSSPGAVTVTASTRTLSQGGGRATLNRSLGNEARKALRRPQPCRAATSDFQCATASSTGARARATRIELAIMMPPVASPAITR